jgi:hypothetical protein
MLTFGLGVEKPAVPILCRGRTDETRGARGVVVVVGVDVFSLSRSCLAVMFASRLARLPSVKADDVDEAVSRVGIGSSSNRELARETERIPDGVARPETLILERWDEATLAGRDEPGTAVGGESLEYRTKTPQSGSASK